MSAGLDRGPQQAYPDTDDTIMALAKDILILVIYVGAFAVLFALAAGVAS